MVLLEFPDLTWLRQQIYSRFESGVGWQGRVLNQGGWYLSLSISRLIFFAIFVMPSFSWPAFIYMKNVTL